MPIENFMTADYEITIYLNNPMNPCKYTQTEIPYITLVHTYISYIVCCIHRKEV